MKKILRSAIFWIFAVEIIVAILFLLLGFRITYSPHLENSWDAISAVAEWVGAIVGAIVVPVAALWIQHKWDINKRDVAASNLETIKELAVFKEKFEPLLTALDEGNIIFDGGSALDCENASTANLKESVLQYIAISMEATENGIAEYFNISPEKARKIINGLIENGSIVAIGHAGKKKYKIARHSRK